MTVDASSGGGRGRAGFVHQAALYGSDQELLGTAVPFLRAGLAAGEPTLLSVSGRLEDLVREALGDAATGLTSVAATERYAHPMAALRLNHEMLGRLVRAGAERIRMVGEVPQAPGAASWDGWVRYEAVINHFYAGFPLWSICPYDLRSTPEPVLADVERTHTHLASPDGRGRANPRYAEPDAFLAERFRREIDPLEESPPQLELVDPSLAAGRRAITALASTVRLALEAVDGLVIAVNEVLANALVHGHPPVELRAWAAPDRVVVAVRDRGPGPRDPFAGFLPDQSTASGGLGLWLANQLCDRVTLSSSTAGFTVRLVAGAPQEPDNRD